MVHSHNSKATGQMMMMKMMNDDDDEWYQFPPLQPRAELRRNQRGEIGRQHIKGASGSRFSPL